MKWSDVNIEEFIELSELALDELSPTEFRLERIAILTGQLNYDINEDEIDELLKEWAWLDEPIPQTYKTEGLKDFNTLPFGEFISLEKFITEKAPIFNIDKIGAILYFDDFNKGLKEVNEWSVVDVYGAMESYLKYRTDLLTRINLFEKDEQEEEIEEEEEPTPYTWELVAYDLSDGDVVRANELFKMPHLLVLNWMMLKEYVISRQRSQTASNHSDSQLNE
jgi:hypothetical protein